jgi:hypothetical protein
MIFFAPTRFGRTVPRRRDRTVPRRRDALPKLRPIRPARRSPSPFVQLDWIDWVRPARRSPSLTGFVQLDWIDWIDWICG